MLLACVQVAVRIDRYAPDCEKLAGESTAAADHAHLRERVALEHDDLFVLSVGYVHEPLLRIARERNVPRRPERRHRAELAGDHRSLRVLDNESFLHEGAVLLKNLDPVA